MPPSFLVHLVLALATAELVHAIVEMLSARFKLDQLASYVATGHARELPVDVDTRAKAYGVIVGVAVVLTGVSLVVFSLLDLSATASFGYLLVVLVLSYAVPALGWDRFHVAIGALAQRFRRP